MIPIIGTMIGAYIIARMIELMSIDRPFAVKFVSVVTTLVAAFGIIALLGSGSGVDGLR